MVSHIPTTAPSSDKSHIFISYSRRDAMSLAVQLETDLENHGLKTWRDRLVRPGVPFGPELQSAIDNSFAMIALITPGACRSYWVKCEWCYAISRGDVTIIPVVVKTFDERLFPIELFPISRLYMTDDYSASIESIIAALTFAQESPPVW